MNAVTEQFMALQKYLWVFKTQYQTRPMNKVQYIHINTVKSQMGTTLEETLRYALNY